MKNEMAASCDNCTKPTQNYAEHEDWIHIEGTSSIYISLTRDGKETSENERQFDFCCRDCLLSYINAMSEVVPIK